MRREGLQDPGLGKCEPRDRETYQENHPGSVVGEDDQANSDEAESHHLVCPRGLEKREGSAVEVTLMEVAWQLVYALSFPSLNRCTEELTLHQSLGGECRASALSPVHKPAGEQSRSRAPAAEQTPCQTP
jgi:hypothetical protein